MTKPKKASQKKNANKKKSKEGQEKQKLPDELAPDDHSNDDQTSSSTEIAELISAPGLKSAEVDRDENNLLTIARARILALWVAMISDSPASSSDVFTRFGIATSPKNIAEILLVLATKLEEKAMIKRSTLIDIHEWSKADLYDAHLKFEAGDVLIRIELTRRHIRPVGEYQHEKYHLHTKLALSEQDSLGEDIYDFSDYEALDNKFEMNYLPSSLPSISSPLLANYPTRDFGHSTGLVPSSLPTPFPSSPLAGPNRALCVLIHTEAAFRCWYGMSSFMDHPHGESSPVKQITKRTLFKESQYLLSSPECCLLLCWLGEDDTREDKTRIDDLSQALEQIESWSDGFLKLIAQEEDLGKHIILVNKVVKEAHWTFVKLLEKNKEYARALQAQEMLRNSKLFEITEKEKVTISENAKKYRWGEMNRQSEALMLDGDYAACQALNEKALASPELFISSKEDKIVSQILVRTCQQKLSQKQEEQVVSKSKVKTKSLVSSAKKSEDLSIDPNTPECGDTEEKLIDYVCNLSDEELQRLLLLHSKEDALFAADAAQLEEKISHVKDLIEQLHDMLQEESAKKKAPPKPSATQSSMDVSLRDLWPCHQTVGELVFEQPEEVDVYECMTCRSPDHGKLHLICGNCALVNHQHHGHRTRKLGKHRECDDKIKSCPWCPDLNVTPSFNLKDTQPRVSKEILCSVIQTSQNNHVQVELQLPQKGACREYVSNMFKKAKYANTLKSLLTTEEETRQKLVKWTQDWVTKMEKITADIKKAEIVLEHCNDIYGCDGDLIECNRESVAEDVGMDHTDDVEMKDIQSSDLDDLEAGHWEEKKKKNQMKEIQADLTKLKLDRQEFDRHLVSDLMFFTRDLWSLRCLYKQYTLSCLAALLTRKIKKGEAQSVIDQKIEAERMKTEEADRMAKALEEEESKLRKKVKGETQVAKKHQTGKKQTNKSKSRGVSKELLLKQEAEKKRLEMEEAEEKARLKRREVWLAEQKALREAKEEAARSMQLEARAKEEVQLMEQTFHTLHVVEDDMKVPLEQGTSQQLVQKVPPSLSDIQTTSSTQSVEGVSMHEEINLEGAVVVRAEKEDNHVQVSKNKSKKVKKLKAVKENPPTFSTTNLLNESKVENEQVATMNNEDNKQFDSEKGKEENEKTMKEEEEEGFVVSFGDVGEVKVTNEEVVPSNGEVQSGGDTENEYEEEYAEEEYAEEEYEEEEYGVSMGHPSTYPTMPYMYPNGMPHYPMMPPPAAMMPHMPHGYFVPPPDPSQTVAPQYYPMNYPMYMPMMHMAGHDMYYRGDAPAGQSGKGKEKGSKGKGSRKGSKVPKFIAAAVMKGAVDTLLSLNLAPWLSREYAEVLLSWRNGNVQEAADMLMQDKNNKLQSQLSKPKRRPKRIINPNKHQNNRSAEST